MASTYVNDLRLEEIADGEQSGTWGATTNTNLELIGQAFSWGTRAIANASTDNITIADGAADADRSLALKLTGGGQACTVTLLPNTSSKVWIMNNATSYTLTFTCGSGANVAIEAGETKVIATDGLGSGGVVYDLLTNLSTTGIVTTGALNAGSITSGFGTIDNGSSTITTTGTVATGAITAGGDLTRGGTVILDGSITDTGDFTLDIVGDIILDAGGDDILLKSGGVHEGNINFTSSNLTIKSIVSDADMIFQGNDGGVEITAMTLDMSAAGAATFNNDVTAFSDKRLKKDIKPITNALTKVMPMQGVYYKRNDVEDAREQIGVLAQDMEAILPEVVLTADDEMQTKSVDYGKITSVLIEAIKELKKEINELKGV